MRRLAWIALALVLAAGCGGGKKKAAPDPGKAVLGAFLRAAGAGDTKAMRRELSPESAARRDAADLQRLAGTLRPLARSFRLVVSERVTDAFGVAAAVGRGRAYGAAFRLVGGDWKLELGGPVRVRALGPDPGSRRREVRQVAAEVSGASGAGYALLWLDGVTVPAMTARFLTRLTAYANLPIRVPAGEHSVVAFASEGNEASALAWTFSVPR